METAGDVRMINEGQQLEVRPASIVAILSLHYSCMVDVGIIFLTASPRSTLRSALCLMGGGAMFEVSQDFLCLYSLA